MINTVNVLLIDPNMGVLKMASFDETLNQKEIASLRTAYATSGWKGYLQKQLEIKQLQAGQGKLRPFEIASLYARLENNKNAIEWLKRAYEERSSGMARLLVEDSFDKLRSDPEFVEIMKKMNFPK